MRVADNRGIRVAYWPAFLLRDIPDTLRSRLSQDAILEELSISDIARAILCQHYQLFCPPVSTQNSPLDIGATTFLLRLQPELMEELQADARHTGTMLRQNILNILQNHYKKEQQ